MAVGSEEAVSKIAVGSCLRLQVAVVEHIVAALSVDIALVQYHFGIAGEVIAAEKRVIILGKSVLVGVHHHQTGFFGKFEALATEFGVHIVIFQECALTEHRTRNHSGRNILVDMQLAVVLAYIFESKAQIGYNARHHNFVAAVARLVERVELSAVDAGGIPLCVAVEERQVGILYASVKAPYAHPVVAGGIVESRHAVHSRKVVVGTQHSGVGICGVGTAYHEVGPRGLCDVRPVVAQFFVISVVASESREVGGIETVGKHAYMLLCFPVVAVINLVGRRTVKEVVARNRSKSEKRQYRQYILDFHVVVM